MADQTNPNDPSYYNDPSNSAVKPGYKTTEFWITTAVQALAALLTSGILNPAEKTQAWIIQVGGIILALAAQHGYLNQRSVVKAAASSAASAVQASKALQAAPSPGSEMAPEQLNG